jgi:hypothetical protein
MVNNGARRNFFQLILWFCSAARTAKPLLPRVVFAIFASSFAIAQEIPDLPVVQSEIKLPSAPVQQSASDATDSAFDAESHERLFLVVPAFGITNRQDAPALSARQKFKLASRQTFDPFMWISSGIQAGLSQASNEFPQYGQGSIGYGKRDGAAMLDAVNGGYVSTALCVLLKQDPRYFRLGSGSIEHRILYSLAQQVSAKSDKGTRQVNWSNLLGTFASSAVSNAYYPRPNRGFGLTMNRAAVSLLWGFTGEFTDEFGPDISHKLFHRHN